MIQTDSSPHFHERSQENAAIASRSHYPPRADEPIDWSARLFDTDGYEHQLIALGSRQAVTKLSFVFVIWNRQSGECVAYEHMHTLGEPALRLRNRPLTDVEKEQKRRDALQALREMACTGDQTRVTKTAH